MGRPRPRGRVLTGPATWRPRHLTAIAMRFNEETMSPADQQPAPQPAPPPAPGPPAEGELITAVADTLVLAYGVHPAAITRIPQGTATDNFAVLDQDGQRHFAKVYRTRDHLDRERASVELSEYCARAGVATARATRTREHELLATHGRLAMSLWAYVPHTATAEGGLTRARWAAAGTAMGRLHMRLSTHPAAAPHQEPGTAVCDVAASRHRFERLIRAYEHKSWLTEFETWALQAAREREAILGNVEYTLASLPRLTVQVLHGDMAGPNVLFQHHEVAAMVDFRPPAPGYLAWDIARLSCDPQSVLETSAENWITGYTELTLAYRDTNPKASTDDLLFSLRVGCTAMLCSAFPLSVPVERPHLVDTAMETYGRVRHEAALLLLDRLPAFEKALRDALR
ncbi:phosphotransferase enzyme family protein [Streptomyces sp. NPDC059070]|uniref:phosphotransferase enzyme family protein n=1 Tax=Streptomyces sp. NPDC059070 TaxID=3346713 RepID=UPI0036BE3638